MMRHRFAMGVGLLADLDDKDRQYIVVSMTPRDDENISEGGAARVRAFGADAPSKP